MDVLYLIAAGLALWAGLGLSILVCIFGSVIAGTRAPEGTHRRQHRRHHGDRRRCQRGGVLRRASPRLRSAVLTTQADLPEDYVDAIRQHVVGKTEKAAPAAIKTRVDIV